MPGIKPIEPTFKLKVLSAGQLAKIRTATLHILEHVGVRFPSNRALGVFAEHGARVDTDTQIAYLPPELVLEAMGRAPRIYTLSGRAEGTDLVLDGTASYFCTDGCGTLTIDFETGKQRASRKDDVAQMARVSDYLSSIAFYWPMVSAQDFGRLAPLHELDASFNSTIKHGQEYIYQNRKDSSRTALARKILELAIEQGRVRPALA